MADMHDVASDKILVAGAGIAGLSAALAFARRGFSVDIFEQAERLDEIGAGLQLSPNATRILAGMGVLDRLMPLAVEPEAVVLRRGSDLTQISRLPMGAYARQRWGAPYLVCHRADLQGALVEAVAANPGIKLTTGARVQDFVLDPPGLLVEEDGPAASHAGRLVVAADGVWSAIRAQSGLKGESRFVGQVAWRRSIPANDPGWQALAGDGVVVTAFLAPDFHLVAYPMRGGAEVNLVAFTQYRKELPRVWAETIDPTVLRQAMRGASPALAELAGAGTPWSAHPLHVADLDGPWSHPGGLVLIGDAAHAMTPFAAQGAVMAIEDAEMLAMRVAAGMNDLPAALTDWTVARRRRVLKVARRGALNQFAWHASGPVALARDMFLRMRGPNRLVADLDWLYGWKAQ